MKRSRPGHASKIAIEVSSGNIYRDLGYADSESMLVKAQLVAKIAEILRQRRVTQKEAARLLRLTQPKISRLLAGQFRGISEGRLLRCLTRLGRDVQIVVRQTTPRRVLGRVTIRFA